MLAIASAPDMMDQPETQIKKKGGSFDVDVWLFCDLASLPRSLVVWARNSIFIDDGQQRRYQ